MDKIKTSSKNEIEKMENWLNEHGLPDFEYLQALATDGSPEAMEKLRLIADDLNVEYNSDISSEELIGKIILNNDSNEDDEIA